MADLKSLIEGLSVLQLKGDLNCDIREVHFDSRKVAPGDLFVAVRGTQTDGHRFIASVTEKGALAIVCEELPDVLSADLTYIVVTDAAYALGRIAQAYYGYPSRSLTLVGVTGTNGKTTTATLLYRLFSSLGIRCGLLSTIRNYVGSEIIPSTHTTGDALQITGHLAEMVAQGCSHCFMEVTSHAVHQHRIAGLEFDGAIFTNLTQDHLDYHGTMEAYAEVKKSWFDSLAPASFALTNIDSPYGPQMLGDSAARCATYGTSLEADYPLRVLENHQDGLTVALSGVEMNTKLIGLFNAYNIAAAVGAANLLGLSLEEAAAAIEQIQPVEGRMQSVPDTGNVRIVVDFAHTPDAVENVLQTLREFKGDGSRIITVLGCGGDRDQDKRSSMARAANDLSDALIITADNPRSESPDAIASDMLAGLPNREKVEVILDRRRAIFHACSRARGQDIVLIAGKGHEKFQEINGAKTPFDDVLVAQEAMNCRSPS